MTRPPLLRLTSLVLTGLLLITLANAQTPDGRGPSRRRAEDEKKVAALREKLQLSVQLSGFDDPETTLQDALDYLERAHDLHFHVNEQAFRREGGDDILKSKLQGPVPKLKNVSLGTVLRKILARVPSASGATFIPRGDGIEITTLDAYRAEYYPARPNGPFPPLAFTNFEKKPLDEALKKLAEDTDANILLDEARAGEKGKALVTARLADVPLDTAVLLLADMAELKAVEIDGVYYVTTRENAQALRKEQEKAPPAKAEEAKPEKSAKPEPKQKKDQ
jgi:hypothetical protein